jgi:MFS family permease
MVAVTLVQSFAGALLVVTLPFARTDLGLSQGTASLVLALIRLGSFSAIAFAVWGDRIGRRRPLLAALLFLLAANVATGLAPGVVAYTLLQAVARAASGAVAALAIVFIAEEITPTVRSFSMGIWGVAGSLAGGLAFLLAPLFENPDDRWRWLFIGSAIGILVYPLLSKYLRESRAFAVTGEEEVSWFASFSGDTRPYFIALAGIAFAVGGFSGPAVSFASDYLINDLGWTVASSSFTIISAGALGATGLLIGGRVADRIGRRPVIIAGMVLGASGGSLFYWQPGAWLVIWIVVGSFGSSVFVPAFTAIRSELFPTTERAAASAWLSAVSVTGAITGLAFGKWAIDTWGLPTTVTVLGAIAVLAVPLVLTLPETRGISLVPAATTARNTTVRVSPAAPGSEPSAPTTPQPGPSPAGPPAPRPPEPPHSP